MFRQLPYALIGILKQKSFVETELEKDSTTKNVLSKAKVRCNFLNQKFQKGIFRLQMTERQKQEEIPRKFARKLTNSNK